MPIAKVEQDDNIHFNIRTPFRTVSGNTFNFVRGVRWALFVRKRALPYQVSVNYPDVLESNAVGDCLAVGFDYASY
jgi:hypothetical protein